MDFSSNSDNEKTIGVSVLDGLNQLREEGTFCDITLRAGEKAIRAHKNVICACSPYFDKLLGPLREANYAEIVINDIDADYLEMFIEYMYTGTLNFGATNVKDVLLAASFLNMSSAKELCTKFMENNLVMDNCIEYILFAGKNKVKSLTKASLEMAVLNFHHIFSKNDYLLINFEEFKQMIQMLIYNGHVEDLIYAFVMRWIDYCPEVRTGYMTKLLEPLDFSLISPGVMDPLEIVQESEYILISRRLGRFRPLRVKLFSNSTPFPLESMPNGITDGSYACNGYYVYHQGGWKGNKELLTESYVHHPTNRMWLPFVPLQQARAYHHSCVNNGRIYSVGGSDGFKALPSVEFTDPYTGQRGFIDPLPRAKERAGLCLHENSKYVVGGSDRGKRYKCIHRFDGREGVWQELKPSPYRAGATSCAVLADNIYTTHPDTLQRYEVRANDWSLIFAQYKRYPQEVFSFENELFGIFDGHIAKFLSDRGKWENLQPLKFHHTHLQISTNLRFPNSVQMGDNMPLLRRFRWERPQNDDDDEEEDIQMLL